MDFCGSCPEDTSLDNLTVVASRAGIQGSAEPAMDKLSRQKTNKETLDLNYMLDQMDLTDIYRTFYPKTPFFSRAHKTFTGHIIC